MQAANGNRVYTKSLLYPLDDPHEDYWATNIDPPIAYYPSSERTDDANGGVEEVPSTSPPIPPPPTAPADLPSATEVLQGKHVRLEPLDMERHGPSLYQRFCVEEAARQEAIAKTVAGEGDTTSEQQDDNVFSKSKADGLRKNRTGRFRCINWAWHTKGPFSNYDEDEQGYKAVYSKMASKPMNCDTSVPVFERMQFYAWILEKDDAAKEEKGEKESEGGSEHKKASLGAVGVGALFRASPADRCIEIGHLMFCPENLQGTTASTESFFLTMQYVFRKLRYRRYEWKTNGQNVVSQAAALNLGFKFEGIFFQHCITGQGKNRDTWWSSMTDEAWFNYIERGYQTYLVYSEEWDEAMKRKEDKMMDEGKAGKKETSSSFDPLLAAPRKKLIEFLVESKAQWRKQKESSSRDGGETSVSS